MWPSETFNFLRSEIGWRSEQFAGAGAKLQALRAALRTHKSLEPMRRNWPRVLCLRRLRSLRHFKLFQPPRKIQKAPERSHQKFGATFWYLGFHGAVWPYGAWCHRGVVGIIGDGHLAAALWFSYFSCLPWLAMASTASTFSFSSSDFRARLIFCTASDKLKSHQLSLQGHGKM